MNLGGDEEDLARVISRAEATGASLTLYLEVTGWAASLSTLFPERQYVLKHACSMVEAIEAAVSTWGLDPLS